MAREYCQYLFLSNLYLEKQAESILFKVGTALRIVYGSPRFSEDLDFSCFGLLMNKLEATMLNAMTEIEKIGVKSEIEESKATTGGYLGVFRFKFLDYNESIKVECSFRTKQRLKPDINLVNSDYMPPFNILCLPMQRLAEEKAIALLTRTKPRDFYDVYFILRSHLFEEKINWN